MPRSVTCFAAFLLALSVIPTTAIRAQETENDVNPYYVKRLSPRWQAEFAHLHLLMNRYQQRQFMQLGSDEAREAWVERFWKSQDPTPTTPENEMRALHDERVEIARTRFDKAMWPGFDKRGEMVIRYGLPDYRGKIYAEVDAHEYKPPRELWYWRDHNMLLAFQDFQGTGEYGFAISRWGAQEYLSPRLIEFLVYDANESYEGLIPGDILDSEYVPSSQAGVRKAAGMDAEHGFHEEPFRQNPEQSHLMNQGIEMTHNAQATLEDYPSSYPYNFEKEKQFPFFFSVEQFKGGPSLARVDVSLELPMILQEHERAEGMRDFDATVVYFDSDYNELARLERIVRVPLQPSMVVSPLLIPSQLVRTLGDGYYRAAVSVRDTDTGRTSAYWTTVRPRNFDGRLCVSDLLFCQKIDAAAESSSFNRGALEVVPHPVRRYIRGALMPVYFEVYNLALDETNRSAYEIEYRIIPYRRGPKGFWERFRSDEPVVSSTFDGSGYSHDEPLHLSINTENMSDGTYELLITVKDVTAQDVVAGRSTFKVINEPFELAP